MKYLILLFIIIFPNYFLTQGLDFADNLVLKRGFVDSSFLLHTIQTHRGLQNAQYILKNNAGIYDFFYYLDYSNLKENDSVFITIEGRPYYGRGEVLYTNNRFNYYFNDSISGGLMDTNFARIFIINPYFYDGTKISKIVKTPIIVDRLTGENIQQKKGATSVKLNSTTNVKFIVFGKLRESFQEFICDSGDRFNPRFCFEEIDCSHYKRYKAFDTVRTDQGYKVFKGELMDYRKMKKKYKKRNKY